MSLERLIVKMAIARIMDSKILDMPTVGKIGKIRIFMNQRHTGNEAKNLPRGSRNEHNPPHVHVNGPDTEAEITIEDKIITGKIDPKYKKEILEWISKKKPRLLSMWKNQDFQNLN